MPSSHPWMLDVDVDVDHGKDHPYPDMRMIMEEMIETQDMMVYDEHLDKWKVETIRALSFPQYP